VIGEKARGLVPPRPNLGPEPWREPDSLPRPLLAMAIILVAILLVAWAWRRRSLRAGGAGTPTVAPSAADPGPRGQLVGLSETIRNALAEQFGHSLRARTTEELSADERLVQLLGEERFRELMQFLDRVDRIKFAPESPADQVEALREAWMTWEPAMKALVERIRAKPRNRPGPEPARPHRRT
jgi:hypothetical protein